MKNPFVEKNRGIGGFSLIELLMVLAITAALVAVTYFSFSGYTSYQVLEKNVDVVQSYIEKARLQSVNSKNFSDYGIKFASSSVTLFTGSTYVSGSSTNIVYTLGSQIQASAINLTGGASQIYFNNVTGDPSATGTVTFVIIGNASSTKTVTIYGTGLSEVK